MVMAEVTDAAMAEVIIEVMVGVIIGAMEGDITADIVMVMAMANIMVIQQFPIQRSLPRIFAKEIC